MDTALVWFRDDLRVTDNPVLADAAERADSVVPVYVVDPRRRGNSEYGPAKLGAHRARFRRESLQDLRTSLRDCGGDLLVREGRVESVVPEIAETVDADAVFAQTKPATEELEREHAVRAALPEDTDLERRWTHTLYHIDDLPTPYDQINDTFTPWRKSVEGSTTVRDPVPAPDSLPAVDLDSGAIPTLDDLGVPNPEAAEDGDDRAVLPFEGGTTERLLLGG